MVKTRLPTWQNNLIFFGLICFMVLVYYLFQIQQARKILGKHLLSHAKLVSEVVTYTARGAVLSKELLDELMTSFLGNTARFIAYLDSIEPFREEELSSLAKEIGLSCISIKRNGSETISKTLCPHFRDRMYSQKIGLDHDKNLHRYLYGHKEDDLFITLAVSAAKIEDLQAQTGLSQVMAHIAEVPEIRSVQLLPLAGKEGISFFQKRKERLAKAVLPFDNQTVEIVLEVTDLSKMVSRLWLDFFIFGFGLAFFGLGLSYLLYRQQMAHIRQIKEFEDSLSKQRQVAVIGRIAATVAHEIRNPLNVISMGLQRLRLESTNLEHEEQQVIDIIQREVSRMDERVEDLLGLAKPRPPKPEPVDFHSLVEDILLLYEKELKVRKIKLTRDIRPGRKIHLDHDQMIQLIENILKNAIEAQESGGFVDVSVFQREGFQFFVVRNGGVKLSPHEADSLLEPYFTTKPKGTGLGLYISARIARAHGGDISFQFPREGVIEVTVSLKNLLEDA